MKIIKKILIMIFCFTILLNLNNNAFAETSKEESPKKYVFDYNNDLKQETVDYINEISDYIYKKNGVKIVVGSCENLDESSARFRLIDICEELDIDYEKDTNFVIIMTEKNNRALEFGKDLEVQNYDNSKVNYYVGELYRTTSDYDWDSCVKNGYHATLAKYKKKYNLDIEIPVLEIPRELPQLNNRKLTLYIILTIVVSIIVNGLLIKKKIKLPLYFLLYISYCSVIAYFTYMEAIKSMPRNPIMAGMFGAIHFICFFFCLLPSKQSMYT